MATNFPTSLDALSNPTSTTSQADSVLGHASQHANANDAIEALQAKVGIDGSAVTSSLDYKVNNTLAPRASPTFTGTVTMPGVVVTSDGRLYGTSLHNNAGSVTGTTNQYIASGTYTPTLGVTNVANVAAQGTAGTAHWIRVGNVVTVWGSIANFAATAAANTTTTFDITLPIAATVTGGSLIGSAILYDIAPISPAAIYGASTKAQFYWRAQSTGATNMGFSFAYVVA